MLTNYHGQLCHFALALLLPMSSPACKYKTDRLDVLLFVLLRCAVPQMPMLGQSQGLQIRLRSCAVYHKYVDADGQQDR